MAAIRGKWALVTGASSGLGADFARRLGERGVNTVLVARREEPMQELSAELAERYRVQAVVVPMDLAEADAPRKLFDQLTADGVEIEILINNAGFGIYGDFVDITWEREREMLQLNIVTLTELTKRFLKPMVERGSGHVLQVASVAAYQPSPTYAAYSATKAYVLSFGEAVAHELRGTGVTMTVLSPGAVATEFLKVAGQRPQFAQRISMIPSRAVTEAGVRAMLRGRASVVPGVVNILAVLATRLLPRRLLAMLADLTIREPER